MKRFFDNLSTVGCLLPFIVGGLVPIVMMFIKLWEFCNGNISLFILNLILIPLSVIGGINVFRGVVAVLEIDEKKFGHVVNKGWRFYLYILIHFGGYVALVYMIVKYI
jgi:hypothetical protein